MSDDDEDDTFDADYGWLDEFEPDPVVYPEDAWDAVEEEGATWSNGLTTWQFLSGTWGKVQ